MVQKGGLRAISVPGPRVHSYEGVRKVNMQLFQKNKLEGL